MMKVMIIEDELLAQERLQQMLKSYDPEMEVVVCLESIEDTVQYLSLKAQPDLLFMDIHLSDGHSFEIFDKITITKPIIFTTAYDTYALEAFKHYSIDYLLKPITEIALANAINKYKSFASAVPNAVDQLLHSGKKNDNATYKNRFLTKVGQRLFFLDTADIAFFSAENKNTFIVDKHNNKYPINTTIEKLELQLDPVQFLRINRKIIVHAVAIEQIKPYFNNRLIIHIKGIPPSEDLVISRDRVSIFKTWAEG
jgi:two-component system response regulator LytT